MSRRGKKGLGLKTGTEHAELHGKERMTEGKIDCSTIAEDPEGGKKSGGRHPALARCRGRKAQISEGGKVLISVSSWKKTK